MGIYNVKQCSVAENHVSAFAPLVAVTPRRERIAEKSIFVASDSINVFDIWFDVCFGFTKTLGLVPGFGNTEA